MQNNLYLTCPAAAPFPYVNAIYNYGTHYKDTPSQDDLHNDPTFVSKTDSSRILYSVDRASWINCGFSTNLTHFFSLFQVFIFPPLHVSSDKRSSSGGNNCINTSSGITHWQGDCSACWLARRTVTLPVCYTRGCVDTIVPSWWWALVAWNM
jgi:hypothetical protein